MAAGSIEKGTTEKPYAFVFPPAADDFSLRRMVERLILGAPRLISHADRRRRPHLPRRVLLVSWRSPTGLTSRIMLERQRYPENPHRPEAPPLEPTTPRWTMPSSWGSRRSRSTSPSRWRRSESRRSSRRRPRCRERSRRARGPAILRCRGLPAAYTFANRALKAGLDVYTSASPVGDDPAPEPSCRAGRRPRADDGQGARPGR